MRAKIPKAYQDLPQKQKDALREFVSEQLEELVVANLEKEEAELQKIWIQYACIVIHRIFGFGNDECLQFIAGWKRMYHQNSKLKSKEEQKIMLDTAMTEIFGNGGYPHEWVEKLDGGN